MEPYTVTSNDPATHDAADEDFDRGSGSDTLSSNRDQGIQNEYESSQEDIISLDNSILSDIFSPSSAAIEKHHDHDVMSSSSHSMSSLPSSFAMSTPLNNRGGGEGGQLSDIFSSSFSAVERHQHQHDVSSRSMSSLPLFAVTLPNNSRMARTKHPYNYATSNNSHDDTDDGVIVPSQEDIISFDDLSNIFSSSDAALDLARDELQQDLARLDETRWHEMHLLSSTSSQRSLLSMPSLPTSSSTSVMTSNDKGGPTGVGKLVRRSRSLMSSSWNDRFQELIQFREANDHCFVPRVYHENPRLSQWVRKQRHQRKRKDRGLHSTLSDERQELLVLAGFCWDSHQALWKERFQSLEVFHFDHGHCVVPSNHPDSSLFNWVRYQRKQFKLYQAGSKSSMNEERVLHLISIGFK